MNAPLLESKGAHAPGHGPLTPAAHATGQRHRAADKLPRSPHKPGPGALDAATACLGGGDGSRGAAGLGPWGVLIGVCPFHLPWPGAPRAGGKQSQGGRRARIPHPTRRLGGSQGATQAALGSPALAGAAAVANLGRLGVCWGWCFGGWSRRARSRLASGRRLQPVVWTPHGAARRTANWGIDSHPQHAADAACSGPGARVGFRNWGRCSRPALAMAALICITYPGAKRGCLAGSRAPFTARHSTH